MSSALASLCAFLIERWSLLLLAPLVLALCITFNLIYLSIYISHFSFSLLTCVLCLADAISSIPGTGLSQEYFVSLFVIILYSFYPFHCQYKGSTPCSDSAQDALDFIGFVLRIFKGAALFTLREGNSSVWRIVSLFCAFHSSCPYTWRDQCVFKI